MTIALNPFAKRSIFLPAATIFDPDEHNLSQIHNVLSLKPSEKINGDRTSLVSIPNDMTPTGLVIYITIGASCCSLSSPSDHGRNYSHLRQTKACSVKGDV